ncbi:MAG: hypothetical protein E7Z73_07840 [Methanobrevibacter millerae]|uniref:Phage-like element PBSX protein XkdF domain-containing protein n=1 Tax=Methanobrevibacter millerae TaxID=230361 RepID=A0A8T3VEL9_9EURY|nr:XkdF-like putative serine protease domain-containing protein [Methanobrevibacter millerae]MBE6505632.1 hypothetical protein [Methanobrevibacter millerae]
MIVKGPILIPGIPDRAGEVLDEETIRKAALIIARNGVLADVQHTLRNVGKILELYVLDNTMQWQGNILPKGTLMGSIDVLDQEIQQAIHDGKYTGFSIAAAPTRSVDEMDRGLIQ